MRETAPETLDGIAHFFAISDWMTWLLCGEAATDPSQAAESGLMDIAAGTWAWDWIDRLEIPRRVFPEIRASTLVEHHPGYFFPNTYSRRIASLIDNCRMAVFSGADSEFIRDLTIASAFLKGE